MNKEKIKDLLGALPFTAELYWFLKFHNSPFNSKYQFKLLHENIDKICKDALQLKRPTANGKKIYIFATLHYWIENAALIGLKYGIEGNQVRLGFLPFQDWITPIRKFDLRQHNLYTKRLLAKMDDFITPVSLLDVKIRSITLPDEIVQIVDEVSKLDVQYTTQSEEVDPKSAFLGFRYRRNEHAAKALLYEFEKFKPDVFIVGNGAIQEFGIAFRIAKLLGIKTISYEFSDQIGKVWIDQNENVMFQKTDKLWESWENRNLSNEQKRKSRIYFQPDNQGR